MKKESGKSKAGFIVVIIKRHSDDIFKLSPKLEII